MTEPASDTEYLPAWCHNHILCDACRGLGMVTFGMHDEYKIACPTCQGFGYLELLKDGVN